MILAAKKKAEKKKADLMAAKKKAALKKKKAQDPVEAKVRSTYKSLLETWKKRKEVRATHDSQGNRLPQPPSLSAQRWSWNSK